MATFVFISGEPFSLILAFAARLMQEAEANFAIANDTVPFHFDVVEVLSISERMDCVIASYRQNQTSAYYISGDGSTCHLGSIDRGGTAALVTGASEVGLKRSFLSGLFSTEQFSWTSFIDFDVLMIVVQIGLPVCKAWSL